MAVLDCFALHQREEAFCRWDDEKTGINPFLPPRSSCKGAGNWIMKYVVGTVVCVIRAPLFVVFSLLVVVAELLSYLVIVYSFP